MPAKRRLLNFLLSNCSWQDGDVIAEFRQPFDLLAETIVAQRELKAAEVISDHLSGIWLPGPDSNQRPSG